MDIPSDSVAEGNPARIVGHMAQMRRKMTPVRVDAAIAEMLRYFIEVELRRVRGLDPVQESSDSWRTRSNREAQRLIIVRSTSPTGSAPSAGGNDVFLINRAGFDARHALSLNFTTMLADVRDDELGKALVDFFKRYYGIQFEHAARGG